MTLPAAVHAYFDFRKATVEEALKNRVAELPAVLTGGASVTGSGYMTGKMPEIWYEPQAANRKQRRASAAQARKRS
jgi:hypothetical protein